jgi:hypothetical protein
MKKTPFKTQTRHLIVVHPKHHSVVLFEADVRITNLNILLVDKIQSIDIKYALKDGSVN